MQLQDDAVVLFSVERLLVFKLCPVILLHMLSVGCLPVTPQELV